MTEKKQLDRLRQLKNKLHLRKVVKMHIDNKIHIIPETLAGGLKEYKQPVTLNQQIASSRFPQELTPNKRMYSEEIGFRKQGDGCKMPNLRLLYRKDEINSDKEKSRRMAMME